MLFTEDNKIDTIETPNPVWEKIEFALEQIDPLNKTFFVLTNDSGSYIQCAGSKDRLTIELRVCKNLDTFKHFVIGKEESTGSTQTIWTEIICRVGPIRVHDNEVLTIKDAIDSFKAFFNHESLPSTYKKRNVTRQFKS